MTIKEKSKPESKLSTFVTLADVEFSAPEKPASKQQFAVWVYALMQNWRQGTVAVKGRSDVARSNKKPWKQKGTGRARAGSARSPLWRGGGIIFGPQPHTRTLRVNQQLKKRVLGTLAADFLNDKKVQMVDWALPEDRPRTKHAMQLLKNLDLDKKNVILFLRQEDANIYASFINIPHVQVIF